MGMEYAQNHLSDARITDDLTALNQYQPLACETRRASLTMASTVAPARTMAKYAVHSFSHPQISLLIVIKQTTWTYNQVRIRLFFVKYCSYSHITSRGSSRLGYLRSSSPQATVRFSTRRKLRSTPQLHISPPAPAS